jgi:peptide/nickel transport system substrate-binding protein
VYSTPEFGVSSLRPVSFMEEVQAPDDQTVVIRWRGPYPDAAALYDASFPPLPRHVLESTVQQGSPDAFTNSRYWDVEFIGAGPYRLERWEPGAFIEAVAFDGHVLGRPKIDRVIVRFVPDENTVLSNLLADGAQFATDRTIRWEHGQALVREWDKKGGTVIFSPIQPRFAAVQLRPEYANPRALTDLRVRRALAHAIDRQAMNDGLFDGAGVTGDTRITSRAPYYADLQRTITHYLLDTRRTEQLMNEAGFVKGPDGLFASPSGERFTLGYLQEIGVQTEREMTILTGTWRAAGFDFQVTAMPTAQLRDGETRSTFPSIHMTAMSPAFRNGERNLEQLTSPNIGTPNNRWRGGNYGGWSHAGYDQLWEAYNTSLERAQRDRQVIEMAKLISDQLPTFFIYWNFNVSAHSSAVRGPDPESIDTRVNWNIHEWEMS